MKTIRLPIREIDRSIFEAIRDGRKSVETRAGSSRYIKIEKGDTVLFKCGDDSFKRQIVAVHHFKTVNALLKKYSVEEINPMVNSEEELKKMYQSFPGYTERLQEFGILAFELK